MGSDLFGVSVVVGAGIFTVKASTAGDVTGPAIWVSFLIAATTCGLAALCYAEFSSTVPVAGSGWSPVGRRPRTIEAAGPDLTSL